MMAGQGKRGKGYLRYPLIVCLGLLVGLPVYGALAQEELEMAPPSGDIVIESDPGLDDMPPPQVISEPDPGLDDKLPPVDSPSEADLGLEEAPPGVVPPSEADLGLGEEPSAPAPSSDPVLESDLGLETPEDAKAPEQAVEVSGDVEGVPDTAPEADVAEDLPVQPELSQADVTGDAPEAHDGLSGMEMADDQPESADEGLDAAVPPSPPKTEQGFQQMLDRKGAAQQPTVDSVKKQIAKEEGHGFKPEKIRSLFFTYWQHEALLDAKRSHGVRTPTQSELNALGTDKDKVKPENRDISLNGIVYVNDEDWTIWINGMRVTPDALPREVMGLQVYKEYIEVKWLDDYTNQIFPIRLRAHQRFNLDMRIFLPG